MKPDLTIGNLGGRISGDDTLRSYARRILVHAGQGRPILLLAPSGSGKLELARTLTDALPPMTWNEARQTTWIWRATGLWDHTLARKTSMWPDQGPVPGRPFRAPHYTCTRAAIRGRSLDGRMVFGEATLAHNGVLYLDSAPDFKRGVLEAVMHIFRERCATVFHDGEVYSAPAKFWLVLGSQPCLCGERRTGTCACDGEAIERYLGRLPLADYYVVRIQGKQ